MENLMLWPFMEQCSFGEASAGGSPAVCTEGPRTPAECLSEKTPTPSQSTLSLHCPGPPLWGPSLDFEGLSCLPSLSGSSPPPHLDPGMLQTLGYGHPSPGRAPQALFSHTSAICTILPTPSRQQGRSFPGSPCCSPALSTPPRSDVDTCLWRPPTPKVTLQPSSKSLK